MYLDVMYWPNLVSVLQDPTWVLDILAHAPNQVTGTSGYGMGVVVDGDRPNHLMHSMP